MFVFWRRVRKSTLFSLLPWSSKTGENLRSFPFQFPPPAARKKAFYIRPDCIIGCVFEGWIESVAKSMKKSGHTWRDFDRNYQKKKQKNEGLESRLRGKEAYFFIYSESFPSVAPRIWWIFLALFPRLVLLWPKFDDRVIPTLSKYDEGGKKMISNFCYTLYLVGKFFAFVSKIPILFSACPLKLR